MDPNAALERIRLNLSDWERYRTTAESEVLDDIVNEVAEAITALDRWLSNGGFLPSDWAHGTPSTAAVQPEPVEELSRCPHCNVRRFDNPNADPALDAMAHLCWKCVKPINEREV